MKIKTGVILAAGNGTRLKHHTLDIPKCLIMIKNKPLIYHIFNLFEELEIKEVIIVVGYMKDKVVKCVNKYKSNFKITFIHQKDRKGIAHAIRLTKNMINEPFIVMLGDEFYWKTNHCEAINSLKEKEFDCMIAIKETTNEEDIKKNYAIKLERDFRVTKVKEKPTVLWNNYFGCGTYIFKPTIFDYIDRTPISFLRNEKEITDTLDVLIKNKKKVYGFPLTGFYKNINYPSDVEKARMFKGE